MGVTRQANQPRAGLTLVELLMALGIFALAGGGIVGAYLFSHQLVESGTERIRATDDLEDIMERIRATPFAALATRFPAGAVDGGGVTDYAALVGGYTLDDQQITVTYPTQAAGRLEVLVTLTWTSRGRMRTASLSTVRTSG